MKSHFVKTEHYRQKAQWRSCTVHKVFLYIHLFYENGRNIICLMEKYSFTCSCGDVMSVDASSQEEAATKLKEMMSEEAIAAHTAEKQRLRRTQ